jgi:hypothetical protein
MDFPGESVELAGAAVALTPKKLAGKGWPKVVIELTSGVVLIAITGLPDALLCDGAPKPEENIGR